MAHEITFLMLFGICLANFAPTVDEEALKTAAKGGMIDLYAESMVDMSTELTGC